MSLSLFVFLPDLLSIYFFHWAESLLQKEAIVFKTPIFLRLISDYFQINFRDSIDVDEMRHVDET